MTNREKIIKALECCKPNAFNGMNCEKCPYKPSSFAEKRDGSCVRLVHAEAINLLKEQDNCENCAMAIEDRQLVIRCKDCKYCVKEPNGELYCDILAVGYEPLGSKRITENWFCADGERRKVK